MNLLDCLVNVFIKYLFASWGVILLQKNGIAVGLALLMFAGHVYAQWQESEVMFKIIDKWSEIPNSICINNGGQLVAKDYGGYYRLFCANKGLGKVAFVRTVGKTVADGVEARMCQFQLYSDYPIVNSNGLRSQAKEVITKVCAGEGGESQIKTKGETDLFDCFKRGRRVSAGGIYHQINSAEAFVTILFYDY